MARMYPEQLPADVLADPRRSAERKVYETFRDGLSDAFTVFYGVAWLAPARGGGARDGESDFVVAHAVYGLLMCEVKGGRLSRDGASGRWTSRDRHGQDHAIKDPFKQSLDGKYNLRTKVQGDPRWPGGRLPVGHAAILPDVTKGGIRLPPDADPAITIDRKDLDAIEPAILNAFRFWQGGSDQEPPNHELGSDRLGLLVHLFAPSFSMRLPLGVVLAEEERELLQLTEAQFGVLNLLRRQRRVAVRGGAGTGKTLLALEKARRLAAEGFRTLLTCFNRPLADFLSDSVGEVDGLRIRGFHQLCFELAGAAGVSMDQGTTAEEKRAFFAERLPEALGEALEQLPDERFDAVVVDEGQDFKESWWLPLLTALAQPDDGILYVFHDDNQRLYGRSVSLPDGLSPVELDENLRNTQSIHRLATRFYDGPGLVARGPSGRPVEAVRLTGASGLERVIGRCLHRLIRDEEIPPGKIAVLTGRSPERSGLGNHDRIGAFRVRSAARVDPQDPRVALDTIWRFKGLERQVVILTELDDLKPEERDRLLYVGVSRARAHLVVVARDETLELLGLREGSEEASALPDSPPAKDQDDRSLRWLLGQLQRRDQKTTLDDANAFLGYTSGYDDVSRCGATSAEQARLVEPDGRPTRRWANDAEVRAQLEAARMVDVETLRRELG
jgi:UvrD-like helicase C-terminal domain/AAA domain